MALKIITREHVEYNGRTREFDVADNNLPGAPRWFIAYRAQEAVPVFISEEVPKPYRKFMVIHELAEFEDFRGQPDPCLQALKTELTHVSGINITDYVRFRKEVFEELIRYHEARSPDSPFIPEMKKSLCHLAAFNPFPMFGDHLT